MLREVILFLALTSPAVAGPGREPLPSDGRLAPVRAQLEAQLDRAAGAGLPTDMLLNKIREGLAKNVEPERIASAVAAVSDHLGAAQAFLAQQRSGKVPGGLLRVVAAARMSGVALKQLQPLVSVAEADRAVQMVVDLKWRGYPAERTVGLVVQILRHDAANLDRLPGLLETLRREQIISHGDSVDALARGMAASDSLSRAYDRAVDDERRRGGNGRGAHKGDDTDVSRANNASPPGLLKVPPGQAKK